MQPTLAREPFHRPGWIYERKEDGWRLLAYKDGSRVRLISRQQVDHTVRFPELAAAVAQLPARRLVLDGELCVFDSQLVSQFHLIGDERPEEPTTPPVLIAFDLLHIGGRDFRGRPLRDRRPVLEDAIAGSRFVLPSLRLESDGFAAWEQVKRGGWEGLVAKDETSRYVPGQTRSWLKVKIRREGRFVVGLDVPLAGACSLLLATRHGRRLLYVGRVEWGATRALVARIREHCTMLSGPICEGAERGGSIVWVHPDVVAEVTYSEVMQGRLRDPVLRWVSIGGQRSNKSN
jgi:bifunctional non-homologous end joining protein LigD